MFKTILIGLSMLSFLLISFSSMSHAQATNPKVLMKTSKGDITIELYSSKAPLSVKNFLSYVDENFYDGTIFHRVIKGFMIQGGGFTTEFHKKPTKSPIKNEAANGLKNKRGTLAMARTMEVNSATSQFFINHADNSPLDYTNSTSEGFGYCVFGNVIDGMDVVDAIAKERTMTRRGMQDVPRETIEIISVQRVDEN